MKSYVALALSAAATLALASAQVPCSDLKQNVLTSSSICPDDCGPNPCVLFSPSQKDGCIYRDGSAAGGCYEAKDFQLTSSSDACDMTYQCLASLVVENKRWSLALKQNKATNVTTTTSVTEIRDIKYPTLSSMTAVELIGGLGDTPRGDMKEVILDKSFFATPPTVNNFFLSAINLPGFLDKIDYDKVKWGNVAWNNVNLDKIPAEFAKLDLKIVQLRQNYIKSIDDATLLAKAVTIDLRDNELTDLNVVFPSATTLMLSRNPLGKIPDAIFQMKSLKKLYLKGCNITNQQFTAEQYTFLNELQTFDADITITDCGSGFAPTNLTSSAIAVCAPGSAPSTDSDGGSNSSVIIIVIIVAAVVVVAGVGGVCFVRRRKPSGNTYTSFNKDGTMGTNDTDYTGMGSDTFGSSSIWNDPDLLAVRIEYRDVEPIKLLSRGGFGEVWLGLYMNENVAIKRLLADKKTMNDALAFAAEVKTMARLDHPKIVRFIGVAWTNALTIQAVTEFMDCGDLRSLLDSSRASSLTWANLKCQIAIDIADALVYLHTLNPKLIHRDLKSRNVLIDANTGAKLSDFGISRNRSVEETMTAGVGTARWIAPEVILGGHYTEFADIYSFGVVLSELDTNKAPFHDATNTNGAKMQDVTILQLVSAGKLQPTFTTSCPEPIIRLAKACMAFDPAQRPSAIHISYELRKILKDEL